ncbi:MAG TPA: hypothetical protein DEQ02_08985 [Ruminococcaceae bacterium]|nr:hypothetical protein [Oscillospiraceae bacterium]
MKPIFFMSGARSFLRLCNRHFRELYLYYITHRLCLPYPPGVVLVCVYELCKENTLGLKKLYEYIPNLKPVKSPRGYFCRGEAEEFGICGYSMRRGYSAAENRPGRQTDFKFVDYIIRLGQI